jgi:cell division protein FtsB
MDLGTVGDMGNVAIVGIFTLPDLLRSNVAFMQENSRLIARNEKLIAHIADLMGRERYTLGVMHDLHQDNRALQLSVEQVYQDNLALTEENDDYRSNAAIRLLGHETPLDLTTGTANLNFQYEA